MLHDEAPKMGNILVEFRSKLKPETWDAIIVQAFGGDPDWLTDMIGEAQRIANIRTSVFYVPEIHEAINKFSPENIVILMKEWQEYSPYWEKQGVEVFGGF